MKKTFSLQEKVWRYPGKASWYFLTIPANTAEEIDFLFAHAKKGFGSLKVTVTIGKTQWPTSIFPDSKSKGYLLPLKKSVRGAEKVRERDAVKFIVEITD